MKQQEFYGFFRNFWGDEFIGVTFTMDFIDFACDMLNKKYKNISNAEWIDVYDDYLFEAIARGQK